METRVSAELEHRKSGHQSSGVRDVWQCHDVFTVMKASCSWLEWLRGLFLHNVQSALAVFCGLSGFLILSRSPMHHCPDISGLGSTSKHMGQHITSNWHDAVCWWLVIKDYVIFSCHFSNCIHNKLIPILIFEHQYCSFVMLSWSLCQWVQRYANMHEYQNMYNV